MVPPRSTIESAQSSSLLTLESAPEKTAWISSLLVGEIFHSDSILSYTDTEVKQANLPIGSTIPKPGLN